MFANLHPKERIAYVALALVFLGAAGYVGGRQLRPRDPIVIQEMSPHRDGPVSSAVPIASQVIVHVAGCVKKPGVYKLPPDARVTDAVQAGGGFSTNADPDRVNLAAKLIDGTQLYVPKKGSTGSIDPNYAGGPSAQAEAAPSGGAAKGGKHPAGVISLSSASAGQLQSIPGIGPSTADRILDYRKEHGGFKSVDELTAVGGIGAKKLERMRKWLRP